MRLTSSLVLVALVLVGTCSRASGTPLREGETGGSEAHKFDKRNPSPRFGSHHNHHTTVVSHNYGASSGGGSGGGGGGFGSGGALKTIGTGAALAGAGAFTATSGSMLAHHLWGGGGDNRESEHSDHGEGGKDRGEGIDDSQRAERSNVDVRPGSAPEQTSGGYAQTSARPRWMTGPNEPVRPVAILMSDGSYEPVPEQEQQPQQLQQYRGAGLAPVYVPQYQNGGGQAAGSGGFVFPNQADAGTP